MVGGLTGYLGASGSASACPAVRSFCDTSEWSGMRSFLPTAGMVGPQLILPHEVSFALVSARAVIIMILCSATRFLTKAGVARPLLVVRTALQSAHSTVFLHESRPCTRE